MTRPILFYSAMYHINNCYKELKYIFSVSVRLLSGHGYIFCGYTFSLVRCWVSAVDVALWLSPSFFHSKLTRPTPETWRSANGYATANRGAKIALVCSQGTGIVVLPLIWR